MELFQVFSINKTPKSQIITALIKSHLPPGILCQIATGQKTRQKPFSPSLLWHLAPYLLQPQIDRTSKAKEAPLMKGRKPCRPLHPISKFGSDSPIPQEHPSFTREETCDIWQRKRLWFMNLPAKTSPSAFLCSLSSSRQGTKENKCAPRWDKNTD